MVSRTARLASFSKSEQEAIENIKEAIALYVEPTEVALHPGAGLGKLTVA